MNGRREGESLQTEPGLQADWSLFFRVQAAGSEKRPHSAVALVLFTGFGNFGFQVLDACFRFINLTLHPNFADQ